MEIISSTCIDEIFVTRFMHTSPSSIVDTGLAVVGLAEALHVHYSTRLPKAQTKRVLKCTREERIEEIKKVGYNVLVVEGCVCSFALFWGGQY